jgi:hypothetical protein
VCISGGVLWSRLETDFKKKEPDVGHRAVIPATWEGWGGSWLEASWTKKVNETPSQPLTWR